MGDYSWTCPYCQQNATILSSNISYRNHEIYLDTVDDKLCLTTHVTVCPNSSCKEYSIGAILRKMQYVTSNWEPVGDPILRWNLRPQSMAKPYPVYIPLPVRQDYTEACLICDLSPKASATLSRRCLQGIIRDFWGVSKNSLFEEITAIKDKVDHSTWSAMDAVRKIGNIGAHMEKDINIIVDVEPQEAKLLIALIEILLKDWYVARHDREQHLQAIIDAAKSKEVDKKIAQ